MVGASSLFRMLDFQINRVNKAQDKGHEVVNRGHTSCSEIHTFKVDRTNYKLAGPMGGDHDHNSGLPGNTAA